MKHAGPDDGKWAFPYNGGLPLAMTC